MTRFLAIRRAFGETDFKHLTLLSAAGALSPSAALSAKFLYEL